MRICYQYQYLTRFRAIITVLNMRGVAIVRSSRAASPEVLWVHEFSGGAA